MEESIIEKKSPYRELAYVESFKNFVKENPKLLETFKDLERKIKDKVESEQISAGDVFEGDGMKITIIKKTTLGTFRPLGSYLKVEVGGEVFFVKTVPGFYVLYNGVQELKSLEKAKSLLADLENVDVVDFKLGYKDENGTTYFVSKWEGGIALMDYLAKLRYEIMQSVKDATSILNLLKEEARISDTLKKIKLRLQSDFVDVFEQNIIYDPKTDKFRIFDIHDRRSLQ
jgi:hypothetical protein